MTLLEKEIPAGAVDPKVADALLKRAAHGELPCAVAFALAVELGVARSVVGRCADQLKIRLVKCQLGLFGYGGKKKIARASEEVCRELEPAIREALTDGVLTCPKVFEIAAATGCGKMEVSGACDRLGIKVKKCQLGAF